MYRARPKFESPRPWGTSPTPVLWKGPRMRGIRVLPSYTEHYASRHFSGMDPSQSRCKPEKCFCYRCTIRRNSTKMSGMRS